MAGGVGQQFNQDVYPQAVRGGMRLYPYGGVISGVSLGAITHNGTTNVLSIAGVGGEVRVDGIRFTLANGTITVPNVVEPAAGQPAVNLEYDIYVRPIRKVKTYTSVPADNVGVDGDKGFYVAEFADRLEIQEVIIKHNGKWVPYNEFRSGASFNEVGDAYKEKPEYNYWQLPFNEITGVEWALAPEKTIYHKRSAYPAWASSMGPSIARIDASLKRASVRLSLAEGSVVTVLETKVNELYIPV